MVQAYVEVEAVPDMTCCVCGCPEESTKMRYVWFDTEETILAYCADHYRQYMVALHGEATAQMLEETGEYGDVMLREGDE